MRAKDYTHFCNSKPMDFRIFLLHGDSRSAQWLWLLLGRAWTRVTRRFFAGVLAARLERQSEGRRQGSERPAISFVDGDRTICSSRNSQDDRYI